MARSLQKVSTVCRADFTVYDSSNSPVTGLVNGDFTKLLAKNGANDATVVTVSEIGTGRYSATFTPASTGVWYLLVKHATHNPRGWDEQFDVTTDGPLAIADVADGILDKADGVETGRTVRQILRLMASVTLGKASGGPGGSVFRDTNDTKNRVTTTADGSGDRTAVAYDAS